MLQHCGGRYSVCTQRLARRWSPPPPLPQPIRISPSPSLAHPTPPPLPLAVSVLHSSRCCVLHDIPCKGRVHCCCNTVLRTCSDDPLWNISSIHFPPALAGPSCRLQFHNFLLNLSLNRHLFYYSGDKMQEAATATSCT